MQSSPYNSTFYETISGASTNSAREILPPLLEVIRPRSMLELGSGSGAWTAVGLEYGIQDCIAVDGEWVKDSHLRIPPALFRRHDLEKPLAMDRKFDLAMSLEVAEHLSPNGSAGLISSLVAHADVILFGAAIKYQGGTHHINEQWPKYWIERFAQAGFDCCDLVRPLVWNNDKVSFYYKQNTFLFLKTNANLELSRKLREMQSDLYAASHNFCLIHPTKYVRMATYESVSLRRLLPKLPKLLFWTLPSMVFSEGYMKLREIITRKRQQS